MSEPTVVFRVEVEAPDMTPRPTLPTQMSRTVWRVEGRDLKSFVDVLCLNRVAFSVSPDRPPLYGEPSA
jgi:hypothetical protein